MASCPPPESQLYVSDLDPSTTEADLNIHFNAFSPSSVKSIRDSLSDLCADISFPSYSLATSAYNTLNNTVLKGRQIRITWYFPHIRKLIESGEGNLYVKNLGGWVTSAILIGLFKYYGWVISCKVETDEQGICKGFGYVQMDSESAAQSAIEGLHDKLYLGRRPKKLYVTKFVKRSERVAQPKPPEPKFTTLYVKDLPSNVTDDHLQQNFSVFGKVISATVVRDENGVSRNFGFVRFSSREEAENAKENCTDLDGKSIFVDWEQSKDERVQQKSNVFVKGLDFTVGDNDLKELFAGCEGVRSANVARNIENGESKGFGFVSFNSPEDAEKAIAKFRGEMLHETNLFVSRPLSKQERLKRRQLSNVYVKHLNFSVDDEELRNLFANYGDIVSAKVMRYDDGRSKEFGFVSFETPEQAQNAIAGLKGTFFHGYCLYVAPAQRKEDRKEFLKVLWNTPQQQYSQYNPGGVYNPNWPNNSHVVAPPEYPQSTSQPFYPNQYMQPQQNIYNTGVYPEDARMPQPFYPNQFMQSQNMNSTSGQYMHPQQNMNNNWVQPDYDPNMNNTGGQFMHPQQNMNNNWLHPDYDPNVNYTGGQFMHPQQNMNNNWVHPYYDPNMNNTGGQFVYPQQNMNNNWIHPEYDPNVSRNINMGDEDYMGHYSEYPFYVPSDYFTGMQSNWGRRQYGRFRRQRNIPPRIRRRRRFDHGEYSNTYAHFRGPQNLAPRDFKGKQGSGESSSTCSQSREWKNNAPKCRWKEKGECSNAKEKEECSNVNAQSEVPTNPAPRDDNHSPKDREKGKRVIEQ